MTKNIMDNCINIQQGYNFVLIRMFFPSNIESIPATIYLIKACFASYFK